MSPTHPAPGRQRAGAALVVAGGLIAVGVVVGAVWALVAPTVPCTMEAAGCGYEPFVGGRFFIAEGMYFVLAVAGGAIAALSTRRWLRDLGWPVVVALAAGGVLASLVAWRVGVWLGPDEPLRAALAPGAMVELPLRLRSAGMLVVWSIASVVVALLIMLGTTELEAPPAA